MKNQSKSYRVVILVVAFLTFASSFPRYMKHHVEPRKHAESAFNTKYHSVYEPKSETHKNSKPALSNQPVTNKNDGIKSHKQKPVTDNSFYVTSVNKQLKHKKGVLSETPWPKYDDTDRLPDPITKPVRTAGHRWKNKEDCTEDYDCSPGRVCTEGWCECMSPEMCYGHHKPVCGSDGVFYPSHCELHRTACVEHRHIRINRAEDCLPKNKDEEDIFSKEKESYDSSEQTEKPDPTNETKDQIAESKSEEQSEEYYDDNDDIVTPAEVPDDGDDSGDESEDDEYDSYSDEYGDEEKDVETTSEEEDKDVTNVVMTTSSETVSDKVKTNDAVKIAKDKLVNNEKTVTDKKQSVSLNDDIVNAKASVATDIQTKEITTPKISCFKDEYIEFKDMLLTFHCKKLGEPDCRLEKVDDRLYLAKRIFQQYDTNTDGYVTRTELAADTSELETDCKLTDLWRYEDISTKDSINLSDFYRFFGLEVPEPTVSSKIMQVTAIVGHALELTCGIEGNDIIWQRHGIDVKTLHMEDITSFTDGSLYINHVNLHHNGFFTCFDRKHPSNVQKHRITVHMVPVLRVIPATQLHEAHSDVRIMCHSEGVPRPTISWEINEVPLPHDHHYIRTNRNDTLLIHDTNYEDDTGAYKCVAENEAGKTQRITTVFIENVNASLKNKENQQTHGYFIVFHKAGYTVYDPMNCNIRHLVSPQFHNFKYIQPGRDKEVMCTSEVCMWGETVTVKGEMVYVTQPQLNRIIVIYIKKFWNPIQVIETDKVPMAVHYVASLDEVWILCWNGQEDSGSKTIVVIRDASKLQRHSIIHTQPVGNKFDLVADLFIAPPNDMGHSFPHGYVTHSGQHGLYKIDLEALKYVKSVDLSTEQCVPLHVAFIPLGGKVIVQCEAEGVHQISYFFLELDYLSDHVIKTWHVRGKPFVTPDSRHMIIVDYDTGDVNIYSISDQGEITFKYMVKTYIISDVAFHRGYDHHGYDAFLNSHLRDELFHINLNTGKMDSLQGEYVWLSDTWIYDSPYHSITGSGVFGNYLVKTSDAGIAIIQAESRQVFCEFKNSKSHKVLWIEP